MSPPGKGIWSPRWLDCSPENSVNFLFQQADHPNFLVNIRSLSKTGGLYGFLNKLRPFFGVGDFYSAAHPEIHYAEDRIVNLAEAFDVLFYLTGTKALTILEEEQPEL